MRYRLVALLLASALAPLGGSATAAVTIDWVAVGNPGNAADTPSSNCWAAGCGSVAYDYSISKYEVTNAQYVELLNAKAVSDPLGLYNTSMGGDATFGGITRSGVSGSYTYAVKSGFADKPVTYVSFYDSLRFANWLNNGQGSGDTETGSYSLLGGTATPSNGTMVTRNGGANIVLTSENEWYKAAYYSASGVYFDYPTGTNTQTGCVAPGSDTGNSANCYPYAYPPGSLTDAGAYGLSDSPYGTYDQGGNMWEWNEQIVGGSGRGIRGGGWSYGASYLSASDKSIGGAQGEDNIVGFRVASLVPECSDGIDNDADTLVDFPADPGCSSPLDATEANPPDSDGDLVEDGLDNCPYTSNPTQSDSGGVNTAVADGIGDACQCGDTNDSGTVTATDATVLSRAIAGLSPYFSVASGLGGGGPGLDKCNVGAASPGVAGCTASDATVIGRAVSLLGPGIAQNCDAALP